MAPKKKDKFVALILINVYNTILYHIKVKLIIYVKIIKYNVKWVCLYKQVITLVSWYLMCIN